MRAEFMGEGNYTYECKEPDCYFCERLGLKPVFVEDPAPEVFIIPMAMIQQKEDEVIVPVNSDISPYQRRKLREMGLPTHRVANYRFSGYR